MIVPYKLPQTAGNEVVGLVEEVGSGVTSFAVGDRVFGRLPLDNIGAFAEYVAVPQRHVYKIPENVSMEEAALAEPGESLGGRRERAGDGGDGGESHQEAFHGLWFLHAGSPAA